MAIAAPATRRPWWRRARFAVVRAVRGVLHLSDTPHRIAIGAAAGGFVMALPVPGQVILGPVLARLLGGNLVASIPWTWINNPFTVLFFLYGQYRLGLVFVDGDGEVMSFAALSTLVDQVQSMPWRDALSRSVDVLGGVLAPLLVGVVLSAIGCAMLIYPVLSRVVQVVQQQKKARYAQWRHSGPSNGHGVDTPR